MRTDHPYGVLVNYSPLCSVNRTVDTGLYEGLQDWFGRKEEKRVSHIYMWGRGGGARAAVVGEMGVRLMSGGSLLGVTMRMQNPWEFTCMFCGKHWTT